MENTNKTASNNQEIIKSRIDSLAVKKIELILKLRSKGLSNYAITRKMAVPYDYIDILAAYVSLMIRGASAEEIIETFNVNSIEDVTELIVGKVWRMDSDGNELLDENGNRILSESIIKAKEAIAKAS